MEAILDIRGIRKNYEDLVVLDHLDMQVKSGEVVVIVGPSGCGKSTLLRCINALERIDEGEVVLDGKVINPQDKQLSKVREKIGMVFQSYELFPHKTVLQNLVLAPVIVKKMDRKEAENHGV